MRISDWSSDVGSSDLTALDELGSGHLHPPLLRSRIGSAAAHYPVGASQGQTERCVALGECVEHVRKVHELLHDDMDDLTFALDLAINAEQPRTHDDAAAFLEHSRPDDQIGDACLVQNGKASGGARVCQ